MIKIEGARAHNLKNVDVDIPRNSLTVITGLSGSGKSSLAFDTIFAEGQRRYIETFSAYVRNFLGGMERPDVDKISGLSPVISIEQKTTNKNPRSTVGTVTEIYDYLRLLYARAGEAFSYETGEKMVKYTEEDVRNLLLKTYDGKRIFLLAPLVQSRKGHYRELFESIRKKGYLYARVDGEIVDIVEGMMVDRYKNHDIEVVVDKLAINEKESERLTKSLETAMKLGDGQVMVVEKDQTDVKHFSKKLMCPTTGLCYRDPSPNNFSFNSPQGACPHCKGLGYVPKLDVEDIDYQEMANFVQGLDMEQQKQWAEKWAESIDAMVECPECHGKRLNKEALYFRIDGKNICDVCDMELSVLYDWITTVEDRMQNKQKAIAHEIIKEISARLKFLLDVGLYYLTLSRSSVSLSGGESQRIRLATQIGAKLVNVLYILDEPSIGLHQRDNVRLINSLKNLRDEGNTVIVVEHDKDMMLEADYVVDMGPRAGRLGGDVVFQGTPKEMLSKDTLTSRYLNGKEKIEIPNIRRGGNGKCLRIIGAKGNNLKDVTVEIPLGKLVCVTGVSGSGKSTLINETLQPYLSQHFYRSQQSPMPFDKIEGVENLDKIVSVDQSPLGRTPRSNPATYTDVFTDIRKLFIEVPEAKMRAYKPGRFSFNVAGGRCEVCGGNGYKTIQMNFLPDVLVPCEACHGKRYNRETLEVRFKGKSIADVLDMTINQAVEFFENQPKILHKIKVLQDVGLGYIKLGQPSSTLSGGESQRVKLATELAKKDTGKTIYILDEPTTGLHFDDIRTLMGVLNRLVDKGNTVIVIEHNLDVIKLADHIIDMGPEGGRQGGEVVVTGTPEDVAMSGKGITSEFLKKELGL
ncbi:MAG: excinuclease ABC subunit UvrA [Prevotellaceae bacterium]|nr:excinuclease ABC subunit UvrA [Candidatus Minthosoma equi]